MQRSGGARGAGRRRRVRYGDAINDVNVSEAAKLLGVSARTVRRWIYRGRLQARRAGRAWSIDRLSLAALISKRLGPLPDAAKTQFSTNRLDRLI